MTYRIGDGTNQISLDDNNGLLSAKDGTFSSFQITDTIFAVDSSVSNNLEVTGRLAVDTTSPSAKVHIVNDTSIDCLRIDDIGGDTTPFIINQSGSVGIGTTNPNYNLRVEGRGLFTTAVGVGTSVTSADVNWPSINIANSSIFQSANLSAFSLNYNAYSSGAFRYSTSNPSARIYMYLGDIMFYTAPTGVAGNAISYTERLKIANSGAITTSSSLSASSISATTFGNIRVNPSTGATSSIYSYAQMVNANFATNNNGAAWFFGHNIYESNGWKYHISALKGVSIYIYNGDLTYRTAPAGTAGDIATLTDRIFIPQTGSITVYESITSTGNFNASTYSNIKISGPTPTLGFIDTDSTHDDFAFKVYNDYINLERSSVGDLSDGTNIVSFTGTGRVGIGTTNPSAPLNVIGNGAFSGNLDVVGDSTVSGNIQAGSGGYNNGHMVLGNYHLWIDSTGNLRVNDGTPLSESDGTVVGLQS